MKTLKQEGIYANRYDDLEHLRTNIEEFTKQYYKWQRLHSALGHRSPEEFDRQSKSRSSEADFRSATMQFLRTVRTI
jgi:putative transposase